MSSGIQSLFKIGMLFLSWRIKKIIGSLNKTIFILGNRKFWLERTYYRNDSKRPAISEPKQILDVTSHLLSGILCKQYTYSLTEK